MDDKENKGISQEFLQQSRRRGKVLVNRRRFRKPKLLL